MGETPMLRINQLILCIFLATTPVSLAQTRVEPGEGATTTRAVTPTTQWTDPPIEARGVWLTSREMLGPRDQLLKKLDDLKAANFNTVLIDTWFRGCVAYPKSEIVPQFSGFNSEDIFKLLIDE